MDSKTEGGESVRNSMDLLPGELIKIIVKTRFKVSGNCPKERQEMKKPLFKITYEEGVRKTSLWYLTQDPPSLPIPS